MRYEFHHLVLKMENPQPMRITEGRFMCYAIFSFLFKRTSFDRLRWSRSTSSDCGRNYSTTIIQLKYTMLLLLRIRDTRRRGFRELRSVYSFCSLFRVNSLSDVS